MAANSTWESEEHLDQLFFFFLILSSLSQAIGMMKD